MVQRTLSYSELDTIKKRYPHFELYYESMLHNNVPEKYNLAYAIPLGKKCIAWFTFYKDKNVLFIMEMNKEKKIVNSAIYPFEFDEKLAFNTILYGVFTQEDNVFIIEDIHYYKGIHISILTNKSKFHYLKLFFENTKNSSELVFALPVFWNYNKDEKLIPERIINSIPYQVHHIQYRSLNEIVPFLNINYNKLEKNEKSKLDLPVYFPIKQDFKKPQYKNTTCFIVKADIQYDIYRLFAYGKNNSLVYVNSACIPDYKTSVFMNSIFRKIKENKNLDYIEESDDEEDFQNISEDKYVDLNKKVQIECVFHYKFKRWIPKKVVKQQRIIHVNQLIFYK
jgi:hypothetical protein